MVRNFEISDKIQQLTKKVLYIINVVIRIKKIVLF